MLRAALIVLALLVALAVGFVAWLLNRPSGGAWLLAHRNASTSDALDD